MANGNSAFLQQWEELRKRARQLEADVDGKLIAYNRMSISQVHLISSTLVDVCMYECIDRETMDNFPCMQIAITKTSLSLLVVRVEFIDAR